ncbi:MAG: hypothetical protein HYW48_10130 [Deltaproteobacteria bacterium]|nr:hypothetical protein [Deltaproteobacteria bacterium]
MALKGNKEHLTVEACYEYLEQYVFTLRSSQHQKRHPDWPGQVGIEIEMLPVVVDRASYPRFPESPPFLHREVSTCLKKLSAKNNWELMEEETGRGERFLSLIRLMIGETITFEPGGQLEYSSQPFPCLQDVLQRVDDLQREIESVLQPCGIQLVQMGMNPWHTVDEIGLQMPKKRYLAMDQYFPSHWGLRMMRQTCSIQVCLDFGNDETALAKRFLAAQLLSPVGAALFANSPCMDRQVNDRQSNRVEVWQNLDAKRTGLIGVRALADKLDKKTCVEQYLAFALACPVVFVTDLAYKVPQPRHSMREWITNGIDGVFPSLQDFIVHLSLLFPEVRCRGYMEIRSIDCQARPWQFAPVGFYIGLLYDQNNLDFVLDLMVPQIPSLDHLNAEAKFGLRDETLKTLASRLMERSVEGLERLREAFTGAGSSQTLRRFHSHFTEKGRTPAQDLTDLLKKKTQAFPTLKDLKELNNRWEAVI